MTKSAKETTDQPGEAIRRLCQQFGVAILYVFGSRAKEVWAWVQAPSRAALTGSADVDVGVKLLPGTRLSVKPKVQLTLALEDLFAAPRVDLVVLDEADPFLAANVIRGERLYAADSYVADEYDLYVLRRAGDLAPLERERQSLILGDDS
jgi:predicted nucleotidyltransferase